jgi:ribosome biogenesis GTPase
MGNIPVQQGILESYGYTDFFSSQMNLEGSGPEVPARIVGSEKTRWRVVSGRGEAWAELSGKLRFRLESGDAERPVTGDWVAVVLPPVGGEGCALIRNVLRRSTALYRNAAGENIERQAVAANVDVVVIVVGLDRDFNPRRLERYSAIVKESGASALVALNKADLELSDRRGGRKHGLEEAGRLARRSVPGAPVLTMSALTGEGIDLLDPYLLPGSTVALVGSSGAGKSTLLNRLAGRALAETKSVREDDSRGRHTTSRRELFRLPSGVLVIDTPGMREIQLWCESDGVESSFPEIEEAARGCRFRDCAHSSEPGCAVEKAVRDGVIDPARLESWRKLSMERDRHFWKRVAVYNRAAEKMSRTRGGKPTRL